MVAVARQKGFVAEKEITVNKKAASVYFLHTSGKPTSENVSGAVSLQYADGTRITRYMLMDKQLAYWWFSSLNTDHSGIAWYGSNDVSKGIGLSWCALDNPHPDKVITKIILHSAQDATIYTVFAISLADRKHFVPVSGPSFGGPDNWAAATAMAALVEGMAGVKDSPKTQAYAVPTLSPRWDQASDTVKAIVRYAASKAYVAYTYTRDATQKKITLNVTGSGKEMNCHILTPSGTKPRQVRVDGAPVAFKTSQIENSSYADFKINLVGTQLVTVDY